MNVPPLTCYPQARLRLLVVTRTTYIAESASQTDVSGYVLSTMLLLNNVIYGLLINRYFFVTQPAVATISLNKQRNDDIAITLYDLMPASLRCCPSVPNTLSEQRF
jgi:hypothetical protein